MTKEGKAREIIEQCGACGGISCDFGEQNECPIFRMCELSGGNSCKSESKVSACREFIGSMQPSKTLLDEYAIAAMTGVIACPVDSGFVWRDDPTFGEFIASSSFDIAAAMMKERARRDEM